MVYSFTWMPHAVILTYLWIVSVNARDLFKIPNSNHKTLLKLYLWCIWALFSWWIVFFFRLQLSYLLWKDKFWLIWHTSWTHDPILTFKMINIWDPRGWNDWNMTCLSHALFHNAWPYRCHFFVYTNNFHILKCRLIFSCRRMMRNYEYIFIVKRRINDDWNIYNVFNDAHRCPWFRQKLFSRTNPSCSWYCNIDNELCITLLSINSSSAVTWQ